MEDQNDHNKMVTYQPNQRLPIAQASLPKYSIVVSAREYELNMEKCIQKKIEATRRPDIVVDDNEVGKCFVVSFSTAAYEQFKEEIKMYYKPSIKKGTVLVREGRDTAANKVDLSLKVKGKNYTVNLYNTTSRAMVNGIGYKKFGKDMASIAKNVLNAPLADLNNMLRTSLQEALVRHQDGGTRAAGQLKETQDSESDPRRRSTRAHKKKAPYDPDDTQDENTHNSMECMICELPVEPANAEECTECGIWVHDTCDIGKPAAEKYCCPMCRYDMEEVMNKAIEAQVQYDNRKGTKPENNSPIQKCQSKAPLSQHTAASSSNTTPGRVLHAAAGHGKMSIKPPTTPTGIYSRGRARGTPGKGRGMGKSTPHVTGLLKPYNRNTISPSQFDPPKQSQEIPKSPTIPIGRKKTASTRTKASSKANTTPSAITTVPAGLNAAAAIPAAQSSTGNPAVAKPAAQSSTKHPAAAKLTAQSSTNNPGNPEIDQSVKAQKTKERELKNWEKSLQHRAIEMTDATKQLAASRITIERYEHEVNQLKASMKLMKETMDAMRLQVDPPCQDSSAQSGAPHQTRTIPGQNQSTPYHGQPLYAAPQHQPHQPQPNPWHCYDHGQISLSQQVINSEMKTQIDRLNLQMEVRSYVEQLEMKNHIERLHSQVEVLQHQQGATQHTYIQPPPLRLPQPQPQPVPYYHPATTWGQIHHTIPSNQAGLVYGRTPHQTWFNGPLQGRHTAGGRHTGSMWNARLGSTRSEGRPGAQEVGRQQHQGGQLPNPSTPHPPPEASEIPFTSRSTANTPVQPGNQSLQHNPGGTPHSVSTLSSAIGANTTPPKTAASSPASQVPLKDAPTYKPSPGLIADIVNHTTEDGQSQVASRPDAAETSPKPASRPNVAETTRKPASSPKHAFTSPRRYRESMPTSQDQDTSSSPTFLDDMSLHPRPRT